jgi:MFS family permease
MMPALALVAATAVSLVGSQLTLVALPWFVLQTTDSAAQTGLTSAFLSLPQFVSGILGGAVIDRVGYRRVSIAADLVSGVGIAAIPLLYLTGGLAFWQILVSVFVGGLLAIPGLTARRAMLPELAEQAGWRLERMNAIFEGVTYIALLVGPAVAGLLVTFVGAANVLWVDAATFVFSAGLVRLAVPHVAVPRSSTAPSLVGQLTAGLRFLAHDRLLLVLAVQLAISNFLLGPLYSVILPVYARDTYGNATVFGLILASLGLGSVGGAVAYGLVGHRLGRRRLWLAGYLAVTLDFAALVVGLPLPVVLGAFLMTGFISGPLNPLLVTVRHERIPPDMRGRVFSTFSAVAQIAQPLGMATGGAAIDVFGFTPAVVTLGGAMLILALALTRVRVLHEMERPRQRG